MPATYSRREDPHHNVNNWDDGYEYIPPGRDSGRGRGADPYYSPPPAASQSQRSARRDSHGPNLPRPPVGEPLRKSRYPSPPSTADDYSRPRRRRSPSPAGTKRRAPGGPNPVYTPPSSRGRPSPPDPYRTAAPRTRSPGRGRSPPPRGRSLPTESPRNPRAPPPYRAYSRSPPPRARRPRGGYDEQPGRVDRSGEGTRRPPRQPSPPVVAQAKAADKVKAKVNRFSGLSPRWQAAAAAGFKAGTMAALQMRGEGGAWKGEKGARVATAALGAAAMDAFNKRGGKGGDRDMERDRDRDRDRVRDRDRDRSRDRARSQDRYRDSRRDRDRDRDRSRDRARSQDRYRDSRRDRDRDRDRYSDRESYRDRDRSPRRGKSKSKSKKQSGLEELGGALGGLLIDQIAKKKR